MRRRRVLAAGGCVLLVAAATAVALSLGGDDEPSSAAADTSPPPVETSEITRGDLTTDHDTTGTVDYGEEWSVPLAPGGVVTSVPPLGTVVQFGQELLRVNDHPLVLAQGAYPMYRELAYTSDRMAGADVLQLQRFLIGAGFDDGGKLTDDGVFGAVTRNALRDWQDAVGLDDTGRIDRTTIMFSETPVRIASDVRVGSDFAALQVSHTDPVVTVATTSDGRIALPVDGAVTIDLPDGSTLDGVVTEQDRQLTADGSVEYLVTIDPAGDLGQEAAAGAITVGVHSTTVDAADALIVPVSALLATANGGFAVEIDDGGGLTHLVAVDVGEVVDAQATITGEVDAGQQVVVPS